MTALVTVIIPVYNRTWQLRRALNSLVGQTYKNFEVVICDDGSTEDVASIVAEFNGKLPLQFTRIKRSGGPARPRNVAASLAQAAWIAFLDSDDWWDSNRIEAIVEYLNDEVDLVYHRLRYIDRNGKLVRRGLSKSVGYPFRCEPLRHMALFDNPIPTSACVVRAAMFRRLGGMTEELNTFDDFDTWLRMVEAGARLKYLDLCLGSYSLSADSMGLVSEKQIKRYIGLFQNHVNHFSDYESQARSRHNYTIGSMWARLDRTDLALEYLLKAKKLPTLVMRLTRYFKVIKLLIMKRIS